MPLSKNLKKAINLSKDRVTDHILEATDEKVSDLIYKRYKLTPEAIQFARGEHFMFRIAYSVTLKDGTNAIRPQKRCPVIKLDLETEIITANKMAQVSLENFILPSRTTRNGKGIEGGDYRAFVESLIVDPKVRAINLDTVYFHEDQ